jgi:hypothetical protein
MDDGWSRTEYGPAVAGRVIVSGRLLVGLMGATDMPLAFTDNVPASGRTLVPDGLDVVADGCDGSDTFRTGDMFAMAEPGLGGSLFFTDKVAFF